MTEPISKRGRQALAHTTPTQKGAEASARGFTKLTKQPRKKGDTNVSERTSRSLMRALEDQAEAHSSQSRFEKVIRSATDAGFLSGHRERIAGRLPDALVKAAKERSGITSDTALLEYAVARVALEDKFVETLLSLKGSVPPGVDLEL